MTKWSDRENFNLDNKSGEITIKNEGIYLVYGQICFIGEKKHQYDARLLLNRDASNPLMNCKHGHYMVSQETIEDRMMPCSFSLAFRNPGNSILTITFQGVGEGEDMGPTLFVRNGVTFIGLVKLY